MLKPLDALAAAPVSDGESLANIRVVQSWTVSDHSTPCTYGEHAQGRIAGVDI